MTIALGILAKDGIVIAADTLESIGDAKTQGRKIFTRLIPKQGRGFCGTGAGGAVYLDALLQRLAHDGFWKAHDHESMRANMDQVLFDFYDKHVLRVLAAHPSAQNIDQALMIGLTQKGESILLSSERGVFRECKEFDAVGIGEDHAKVLLRRLISSGSDIPVELAAYIAAYVVYQVKDARNYVGGGTHVTILQNGEGRYLTPLAIDLLELTFRRHSDFESFAAGYMLGRAARAGSDAQSLVERLESLRTRVNQLQESAALAQGDEWDFQWKEDWKAGKAGELFEAIKGRAILEPFKPSAASSQAQSKRRVRPGSRRGPKVRPPSRE